MCPVGLPAAMLPAVCRSCLRGDETLAIDRKMEPAEARNAVAGATVVIEGSIAAITPTRGSICGESGSEPTVTLPISSLIKTCLIDVAVERVTIESPAVGPLADWRH